MDSENPWSQIDPNTLISPSFGLDTYMDAQSQAMKRAMAINDAQQKLRTQALQQTTLASALNNPSAQNLSAYALANPDAVAGIKQAHDVLDQQAQRQNIQDGTAFFNYLNAGQTDDAIGVLDKRISALKDVGGDTTALDAMKNLAQHDIPRAKLMAGMYLTSVAGDKLAEAMGTSAGFATDQAAKQAGIAKTQAETQQITNPRPETASAGLGPDGQPVFYNPKGPPPANAGAALATTNNGALNGFVQQLTKSENATGNPAAKNPNSSATGNGQFLNGTWLDVVQKYRPDLTQGKSQADILALRSDPQLSAQMTAAYAQDNASALGAAGVPVNGTTLAMAHKLGPGGALAVLRAAPDAKLSTVLPPDVIAANPTLANQPAGAYAQRLASQFGTTEIDATPGDPNATGDAFLKTLPPPRARMIQSIANGDMAMPPSIGRNAAQSQLLAQQVLQYDPTASAINLQARQATRKDFTSGKSAANIKALNTLAGHLEELDQSIDGLNNTNFGWINAPAQAIGQLAGDTNTQKAVARFNGWIAPVASEMTTVLRGSNGAEADIKNWVSQLNSAKSPAALHQTVQDMVRAAQSRLGSLEDSYNNGMAKVDEPLPFLRPSTKDIFDRLAGGGGSGGSTAPATAPVVAVNPQTGARAIYDPASRTWRPG